MSDFRSTFLVIGVLLTTLGLTMILPALTDLAVGAEEWKIFAVAAFVTLFTGLCLSLAFWGRSGNLTIQQAFFLTTTSWLVIAAYAAIPFILSDQDFSYTDAFFEAMSGLTTTGATVMTGLESASRGLLMWRALLQWLGGIGIIITALAVLPMLKVGGMQLFRLESSDTSEKILPRATQIAGLITAIYMGLTLACVVGYYLAGMTAFDAVTHAMTTIATGGFANYDASLAYFDSAAIDTLAIVFMLLGSLPFGLYLVVVRGNLKALTRDSQARTFLSMACILMAVVALYLLLTGTVSGTSALRYGAFNIISIMTGTGYVTADYGLWGGFMVMLFFFAMFIGGCAGSTSCGIKVFRFQVMWQTIGVQMNKAHYPHGVFVPHYNGKPIEDEVLASVMSFVFLFVTCFAVLAFSLSLLGLDFITALSGAASAIANVGPGLGPVIGPAGNYASLPDLAKWLLALGMLLGRLELFTVLVLLLPSFWRS